MKTKLLVILIASTLSNVALAASPFMVKHATAQDGGGRAVVQSSENKSTTLAESLVQLRHCSDHDNGAVSEQQESSAVNSDAKVSPK